MKKLRFELKNLWEEERPKITEIVSQAAKNGDRSENGDYIYGKRKLGEIDRRIRYLQKRIPLLTVVNEQPTDRNRVFFAATVDLKSQTETKKITLVGADELDLENNHISIDSPLAKALLGKKIDDDIRYQINAQSFQFTITDINYGCSE